jgi:hypothetical protein
MAPNRGEKANIIKKGIVSTEQSRMQDKENRLQ